MFVNPLLGHSETDSSISTEAAPLACDQGSPQVPLLPKYGLVQMQPVLLRLQAALLYVLWTGQLKMFGQAALAQRGQVQLEAAMGAMRLPVQVPVAL